MVDNIRYPLNPSDMGKIGILYEANELIIFPTTTQYPTCSPEAIKALFTVLDIDKIIFLFECVLLEKKIHLISNHIALPGLIIEALIGLIFPFEYTHILIPVKLIFRYM